MADFAPTAGESLEATFQDAMVRNPVASLSRFIAQSGAEVGLLENTPTLSAEEATTKYGLSGHLKFDGPIREGAAKNLYDLKQEELLRQYTVAKGPQGLTMDAARLGVGFAAGFLDPLNLAASFIPLGWMGKAGALAEAVTGSRLAGRVAEQALQGAAGAAILEPLIYFPALQEQADYDLADSGLNILFGAGMGALGPIAGATLKKVGLQRLGEFLSPDTRVEIMKHAATSGLEGNAPYAVNRLIELDRKKVEADLKAGRQLTVEEFAALKEAEGATSPIVEGETPEAQAARMMERDAKVNQEIERRQAEFQFDMQEGKIRPENQPKSVQEPSPAHQKLDASEDVESVVKVFEEDGKEITPALQEIRKAVELEDPSAAKSLFSELDEATVELETFSKKETIFNDLVKCATGLGL